MAIGSFGPATRGLAVTPSDTTIVGCRSVFVSGAGDLVVILIDDYDPDNPTANTLTFSSGDNQYHPLACAKIMAASDASGIKALF